MIICYVIFYAVYTISRYTSHNPLPLPHSCCAAPTPSLQADRANEAFRIMHRHHASGSARAAPNAITFNTLISAAAKAGHLEEAVARLDAMVGKGLRPDAFTLSALMTACDRGGRCAVFVVCWCVLLCVLLCVFCCVFLFVWCFMHNAPHLIMTRSCSACCAAVCMNCPSYPHNQPSTPPCYPPTPQA